MTMFDNNNKDNILVLYDGESRPGLFEEASPEYSDEQRLQSITKKLNIPVVFKNVVGVAEVAKVSFRATMPNGTPIPGTANVYIETENGEIITVSTITRYAGFLAHLTLPTFPYCALSYPFFSTVKCNLLNK